MIEKVRTGQSVELKASTWNSFINAANYVNSIQQNSTGKPHQSGLDNLVLVKNTTGRTYPQFAAMGLSDLVIKATDEMEFKSRPPVFTGTQVTSDNENMPFAILLEPLLSNQVGKAMVLGVTQAQVYINDPDDQFAVPQVDCYLGELESSTTGIARILWKAGSSGLQWCVLQLGGAGGGLERSNYNGYFAIYDVSTYNEDDTVKEYRVAVCDGRTWDPETETSEDSLAYCCGNEIHFPCEVKAITNDVDIYIKCGPADTYLNKIIFQTRGASKPTRLGYEYIKIGAVQIDRYNSILSITRMLQTVSFGGLVYVPYAQYADDFALRLLEDETTDSVISDKAAICNGMTWNPRTQTSGASYCTVNGVNERGMPGAVVIDFTYNHSVYLYSKWHDRGRPPAIEVISTTTQLTMSEPGVYGYIMIATAGKHYPPYSGVYNIFWFNIGCVGEYAVVEDEEGES